MQDAYDSRDGETVMLVQRGKHVAVEADKWDRVFPSRKAAERWLSEQGYSYAGTEEDE